MKYIVTGGAGFIGSNLVDTLLARSNNKVIVIDDFSEGKQENLSQHDLNPNLTVVKRSVESFDTESMSIDDIKIFDGVDTVFHLAAKARVQPSIDDPDSFHKSNVTGTFNMLRCAQLNSVRRFVFSSSSSVYGDTDILPTPERSEKNPISPYAVNKLIGEEYCRTFSKVYEIETVCLRYFNVYGERQSLTGGYRLVMGIFAQNRLEGKPLTIFGDGEQRRDFTYVRDVVRANLLASSSNLVGHGDCINIGNGDNRSVNELADLIGGEKEYGPSVLEPKATLADNNKARNLLGWLPTVNLEDWVPGWLKELGL